MPIVGTSRQPALLNDVAFRDGELTGHALAQIETTDSKRHPHTVDLSLTLRGGVLSGAVMTDSVFDGLWRQYLPYWTELGKVAEE